ncbi:hypothetical protein BU23DRAFT_652451 [Bimuria novae-zelandiae CBS 107.79]|uniref:Uncharacterized protein n=1 Tax=Bimuria novae-zelandiae CBS 107.79 TaxID=1447943 RepID=A0A6A5UY77_9PLEO|nr:hypothetical protein BU23DRAFT_652451 [Bimuria novae-zelandiae CBS 107.79]
MRHRAEILHPSKNRDISTSTLPKWPTVRQQFKQLLVILMLVFFLVNELLQRYITSL